MAANSWTTEGTLPFSLSDSPALAVFENVLYCVYEGKKHDGKLWYATFDGLNWSDEKQLTGSSDEYGTTGAPALAVYNNLLYCLHQGSGSDGLIWYTTFDGFAWSEDKKLTGGSKKYGITGSPALAVYRGSLYCLHQGMNTNGWLWLTTFDGKTWSTDQLDPSKTNAYPISGSPAVAVYKGVLYCVRQGQNNSGEIRCATFDGTTWSADEALKIGDEKYGMSASPALEVYDNRLFCVHQGSKDSGKVMCTTFDGHVWSGDQVIPTGTTGYEISASPALAEFRGVLHCLYQAENNSGDMRYGNLRFAPLTEHTDLLDVWGEGRIVVDGVVTGFYESRNLNKTGQMISNGPSRFGEIPNLVPVWDWDRPHFPIADGTVGCITVMGAPITEETAQEMYRVLDKSTGSVVLYGLNPEDVKRFENNMGRLQHEHGAALSAPLDEPTPRPVRVYGFPRRE